MKVLFLSGVYEKENEPEVIRNAKGWIDFAANLFQQKLLSGLTEKQLDYTVLSAPFVGAYPMGSKQLFFHAFNCKNKITYVSFCNVWGIRNVSRAHALKKGILDFVKTEDEEKLIIAYSAHTPFLVAAAYAKKKDPRIKICLVVPDIPQFMNLNANRSRLYDLAKKYDIKKMNRLMGCVDSFILLTEHMKERLPVGEKPCQITEGIIEKSVFYENEEKKEALKKDSSLKYVVYTGTTNAKYGIMSLVQAFSHLPDENLRLVICGSGDSDGMIRQAAENDARILAMGQVPSEKAREWVLKADVLVNPRPNNEEYTRYSFPSKNVEYLASGNPVVAHLLDGMKPVYKEFIIQPQEDSPESLAKAIEIALTHKTDVGAFRQYAEELTAPNVIQRIIELNFKS